MDDCIVGDRPRKLMPSITTYTSDDSLEEDELSGSQDSDTKLSTQKASRQPTQSNEKPPSPDSSSSSSNSDDEGAFASLAEKLAALPVTELIASREFTRARKRIFRNRKHRTESCTQSFAIFFDEIKAQVKAAHPEANFGETVRLIAARWDELPIEKKQEYQQRGIASVQQGDTQSLLLYKTRLLSLNPGKQRICSNPRCTQPVVHDPRWNGQYCSTACVSEHCRVAFMNWCARRVEPKVSSPNIDAPAEALSRKVGLTEFGDSNKLSAPAEEPVAPPLTACALTLTTNQSKIKPEPTSPVSKVGQAATALNAYTKPEEPEISSSVAQRKSLFESFRSPEFSLITAKPVARSATNW
ncbi:hypothetical protein CLF_112803 [Clonorchis sinensis]|uniref:HMG box domain-containing protein n=1 Tax=Clonorchis sinensis TaxID=79923 RepID=G7YX11_CLOSI|nr:hypothetical protein CLF_112803 [Clonorchis sinensis]